MGFLLPENTFAVMCLVLYVEGNLPAKEPGKVGRVLSSWCSVGPENTEGFFHIQLVFFKLIPAFLFEEVKLPQQGNKMCPWEAAGEGTSGLNPP